MRTLPKGYMKRVNQYDPLLRIRWSEIEEVWLFDCVFTRPCSLERAREYILKLRKAGVKDLTPERVNNIIDGTFNLDKWAPCEGPEWVNTGVRCDGLPSLDRLMTMLYYGDLQKVAGTGDHKRDWQYVADYKDQQDATALATKNARRLSHYEDLASEAWDFRMWREGARVALPTNATGIGA